MVYKNDSYGLRSLFGLLFLSVSGCFLTWNIIFSIIDIVRITILIYINRNNYKNYKKHGSLKDSGRVIPSKSFAEFIELTQSTRS